MQGGIPKLKIYNISESDGQNLKFYFAGKNGDMAFENTYAKFRIYPYIYQTEQVATIPEYEAMFDTLPQYIDNIGVDTVSTLNPTDGKIVDVLGEDTFNSVWIDSAQYPPSDKVNNSTDYYMAIVSNPPMPYLKNRILQIWQLSSLLD